MNVEWAADIIAREAIARCLILSEGTFVLWEDWPDVGEHDFERILVHVRRHAISHRPEQERLAEALEFLLKRASVEVES